MSGVLILPAMIVLTELLSPISIALFFYCKLLLIRIVIVGSGSFTSVLIGGIPIPAEIPYVVPVSFIPATRALSRVERPGMVALSGTITILGVVLASV